MKSCFPDIYDKLTLCRYFPPNGNSIFYPTCSSTCDFMIPSSIRRARRSHVPKPLNLSGPGTALTEQSFTEVILCWLMSLGQKRWSNLYRFSRVSQLPREAHLSWSCPAGKDKQFFQPSTQLSSQPTASFNCLSPERAILASQPH